MLVGQYWEEGVRKMAKGHSSRLVCMELFLKTVNMSLHTYMAEDFIKTSHIMTMIQDVLNIHRSCSCDHRPLGSLPEVQDSGCVLSSVSSVGSGDITALYLPLL